MSYISLNDNKYIGTLKENPILEKSKKNQSMVHFTLCCTRKYEQNELCDFIPCIAFGKIAENICRNLTKGSFIYVNGQNQSSVIKIGEKDILKNEIFVKDIIFLNNDLKMKSLCDYEGDIS